MPTPRSRKLMTQTTDHVPSRVRKNIWIAAFMLLVFLAVFLGFGGRRLGSALIRQRVSRSMEHWAISSALWWADWGKWLAPGDGEWDIMRAKCFRLFDRVAEWQESLKSAKATGVSDSWIDVEKKLASIASGRVPENAPLLRKQFVAAGLPADDISAALVRGYLTAGYRERAHRLLLQWEMERPTDAHLAYMWAVYWEALRDREQALSKLKQALREQPEHELARMLLAQIHDSENELELALQEYGELVRRFPSNESSRIGLASILRKLTRSAEAKAILAPLVAKTPPSRDAMFQMAQLAFDAGEFKEVSRWFAGIDLNRIRDAGILGPAASMYALSGDTALGLPLFQRSDAISAMPRRVQDLRVRLAVNPTDYSASSRLQQLMASPVPPLELGQLIPWEPTAKTKSGDSATSGPELYAAKCAICHGISGAGDGRAAQHLFPPPRNFRRERFHLVSSANGAASIEDVENVIRQGMPGSSMPAYDTLSKKQITLLARETLRLHEDGLRDQFVAMMADMGEEVDLDESDDFVHSRSTPQDIVSVPPIGPPDGDAIARGKHIYQQQACAQCHGTTGRGAVDALLCDDVGRPARSRDLAEEAFKGGHEPAALFRRLSIGMPGTPHPACSNLPIDQLVDLVQFCRSLAKAPQRTLTNHQRAIYVRPSAYLAAFPN